MLVFMFHYMLACKYTPEARVPKLQQKQFGLVVLNYKNR